jgi:hypothetical protein
MKQYILYLICFLSISTYAATEESKQKFTAIIPDGTTIELIGLRYIDVRYLKQFKDRDIPWWRPDGSPLPNPPYNRRHRVVGGDSHLFLIRVTGDSSCDGRAVGPLNTTLRIKPVTQKAQAFKEDDLRTFKLRFSTDQKQADIKLGLATGAWKVTDRWSIGPRWTPYNIILGSVDQLILRCPEQVGPDVIAEVTQIKTERATRLILFDKDGNRYKSEGEIQGESAGLVRHVHRFKNLDRSSIERIEFQARDYEYWITFSNVSLQTGHKTQVEVDLKKPGTILPGEALPNFDGIEINPATDQIEGKMILVCFFDMQQRPSRYYLRELSKRAQELKAKDVVVITVQASKTDESKLNEWVKKNNIPFAVGAITADTEKTRFTWGVQSLPWLILTDNKHIIRTEGFGVSELNEKIATIRKSEPPH